VVCAHSNSSLLAARRQQSADDADNPVRFVVSAGMQHALLADFERRFTVKVLEWYGAVDGHIAFDPEAPNLADDGTARRVSTANKPQAEADGSPVQPRSRAAAGGSCAVAGVLTGALAGASYAVLAGAAEAWLAMPIVIQNRFVPSLGLFGETTGLSMLLGALLGIACAPLLAVRRGRLWHLAAVTALWGALALWTAPDAASFRWIGVGVPLLAFFLVALGRRVGQRWRWAPPALALGLLLGALVTPMVYMAATTPARPPIPSLPPAPPGAPDVVMVVLDTVRADHVSAYGYQRPTTPAFDALALDSALFLDASAPGTWSLPSHASLFTGLFASAHRAHDEHRFLDPGPPTLAETLAAAGYDTRCFTANPWISDSLGLTRGFAVSDEAWRTAAMGRSFMFVFRLLDRLGFGSTDKGGADVATHFEDWVRTRPAQAPPAFAFLNFAEAHFPYHQLPASYLTRFTTVPQGELRALSLQLFAAQFGSEAVDPAAAVVATAMYDGGVLYADMLLGRVVKALRRRGSLDRTIVVVLSDHGELLGEHGEFGHGRSLYEPVLHVPLLVRYPLHIRTSARVALPVSTVGVYATVLDLIGIAPTTPLHVGSLLPALTGEAVRGPVLAEQYVAAHGSAPRAGAAGSLLDKDDRFRSYRAGTHKIIEAAKGNTAYFFDLAKDPGEAHDLRDAAPAEAARLEQELRAWRAALALPALAAATRDGGVPAIDPAARQRLRALGYVQ
jgi:arylsulfatase A-like enzyme